MSFSDATLEELAGPGAFGRGYEYYRDGRVARLEMHGDRTIGIVDGTTSYRVELLHDQQDLDGSCDCPASEHVVFCKHCVATALALRDQLTSDVLTARNDGDTVLRDHLLSMDCETLVSHLMTVVHKDPALHGRLLNRARLQEGSMDVGAIKKAITQATPLKDEFEAARVRALFRNLETVLRGILEIAEHLPASDLLNVALHTIKRLDKILERIDDSYGHRFESQELVRELHNAALRRSDWPPEERAVHLLELVLDDPWDQFTGAPFDYVEGLGEEGLVAFFEAVEMRLAALPPLPAGAGYEDKTSYMRLSHFLIAKAERAEDWDDMIRLYEVTATTAVDFERLASLNLRAEKPDLASDWLGRADALNASDRHIRYELWSEVHAALGDWKKAVSTREAAFRRDVSYTGFQRLMHFAEQAGDAIAVRNSVIEYLQDARRPGFWPDELHAFTLVQILREEKDYDQITKNALARIQNSEQLVQVAQWLSGPAPVDATQFYEKAISALIARKTNRCYRAAVRTLVAAKPVFDVCSAGAFDECVSRIREEHFRKRNLMAELDEKLGKA